LPGPAVIVEVVSDSVVFVCVLVVQNYGLTVFAVLVVFLRCFEARLALLPTVEIQLEEHLDGLRTVSLEPEVANALVERLKVVNARIERSEVTNALVERLKVVNAQVERSEVAGAQAAKFFGWH